MEILDLYLRIFIEKNLIINLKKQILKFQMFIKVQKELEMLEYITNYITHKNATSRIRYEFQALRLI